MIIDPVNSSSSPLQYSQYKTDAENIKTTASVVLAKANRTITKIKDQKAEGISPDRRISIFTKCENITEIVGKLQKESDPEAALWQKSLRMCRQLFLKNSLLFGSFPKILKPESIYLRDLLYRWHR